VSRGQRNDSPTVVNRSVGIVRMRTQAMEFSLVTCFGQNDHLQKDIINTYGNYYYHVININVTSFN
jgi:hypothetical protein